VAVSSNKVYSDLFKIFYDIFNTYMADPASEPRNPGSSRQFIFSSYPEADIDENRVKYPLIIIEPADMKNEPFTQVKKKATIDLDIKCYDTRMDKTDSMISNVFAIMDDQIWNLKNKQNIHFLQLTGTDTTWDWHNGQRVHCRKATYSMVWIYTSGLAKGSKQTALHSNAVIS